MKTAIFVPDTLFAQAELYAEWAQCSRSQLYSRALAEFLTRHDPDEVTACWDRAIAELGQPDAELSQRAAREVFGEDPG